jgi:hypothetical protein
MGRTATNSANRTFLRSPFVSSFTSSILVSDCDDNDYDTSIDEVREETKADCKKVRFAELFAVRPIPSSGKGRATPPRGARAGGAVWHSEQSADSINIGRDAGRREVAVQLKCNCGGQLRKGDGKKWGDAENDDVCVACAGRWQIDSVESAHEPDSHEWASDRHGGADRRD